jgi:hypothetical protein
MQEGIMLVKEIKSIAMAMDINPGKMKKVELVRAIQSKEGNKPCFDTAYKSECNQMNCRWREDCLK